MNDPAVKEMIVATLDRVCEILMKKTLSPD